MWCMGLALGTIGFWILVGIVSLLLIAAVEYEKPGWATFSLIVTFTLLWLLGDVNIVALALSNPLLAAGVVAGYFVVGAMWSVGKWWFFVRRSLETYHEARAEFLRRNGIVSFYASDPIPEGLRGKWQKWLNGRTLESFKPHIKDNKGRILTWMVYWPWSMFWTILNDPVKRMFKFIYRQLRAVYQRITDSAFRGAERDFVHTPYEPEPETPEMGNVGDR